MEAASLLFSQRWLLRSSVRISSLNLESCQLAKLDHRRLPHARLLDNHRRRNQRLRNDHSDATEPGGLVAGTFRKVMQQAGESDPPLLLDQGYAEHLIEWLSLSLGLPKYH